MLSATFLTLACGALAAAAWGTADFLAAKAARSVGPALSVVAVNVIGALVFALFYMFNGVPMDITSNAAYYIVAGGVAMGIGQIAFFKALEVGPVSLVSPLTSAYPLFTTLCVVLFFNLSLSAQHWLGIAVIMIGIFLAGEVLAIRRNDWRIGQGPTLAGVVAISWGIGYALLAQALENTAWQTVSLIQLAVTAITCCMAIFAVKGQEKLLSTDNLRGVFSPYIIGAGIIQMIGMIVINAGISRDVSLTPAITALSACYPVLTILLALTHLNEKPKLIPLSGALVTIAGVIILSLA